MRYRILDANGDMSFGRQQRDFYRDQPEAVAQAVVTRLRMGKGEWFLDTTDGTPWSTDVLGRGTEHLYDLAIRARILATTGLQSLDAFSGTLNRETRAVSVQATVTTIYGQTTVST